MACFRVALVRASGSSIDEYSNNEKVAGDGAEFDSDDFLFDTTFFWKPLAYWRQCRRPCIKLAGGQSSGAPDSMRDVV